MSENTHGNRNRDSGRNTYKFLRLKNKNSPVASIKAMTTNKIGRITFAKNAEGPARGNLSTLASQ